VIGVTNNVQVFIIFFMKFAIMPMTDINNRTVSLVSVLSKM